MSKAAVIQEMEKAHLKKNIPDFRVGDTVRIEIRIIEGSKERVQSFQGTVIARHGHGLAETFTMHRVAYGEGMERIFLLHSPRIGKIEVMREGKVRRAKLNYLKGTSGKAAKVPGRAVARKKRIMGTPAAEESAAAAEEEVKEVTEEAAVETPVKEVAAAPEAAKEEVAEVKVEAPAKKAKAAKEEAPEKAAAPEAKAEEPAPDKEEKPEAKPE